MRYRFADLVDMKKLENMMMEFYHLTGIPHGLLDRDGNIVLAGGWQDICTKFYRVNENTVKICRESDKALRKIFESGKEPMLYVCPNGIMEAFVPVIVEGEQIATLMLGQFFKEPPDLDHFRKQAEEAGFDVEAYMKALSQVPIISEEKVKTCMRFFTQMAEMLSSMGLNQLKQKQAEEQLMKSNETLENMVVERTAKLIEANYELQNDIQQRKSIEERLRESEERYRHILKVLPYAICVRDYNTILFANETAARYYGFESPQEIVGKNIEELFVPHPDYKIRYKANLKRILRSGTMPLTEEKLVRISDGKVIYAETATSFVSYNGQRAILVVSRDISERKRLKELRKKMKENTALLNETLQYDKLRAEFFANISHELRTPINVILSAVQISNMLLNETTVVESKKLTKYMHIMKQNTYRLIRLVNNLIDITKIDAGYLKINPVNSDIVNVVEEITLSVAEYIEQRGIDLVFDTDVEEKIIPCDPDKIERIMLNLLSNAIKYTKPGGSITVKITDTSKSLSISVKDTGLGIPKDKQEVIFERFIQVDRSLSRVHEGSGIGLSLVKYLVEMHGGWISVNSEENEGAEFIIDIPFGVLKAEESAEPVVYSAKGNIERINIEFSDIYV